jgi:hypothetical protein
MADENFVEKAVNEIRDWNESGQRLNAILEEIKNKIGDAPLYVTEDGKFFVHPDVSRILNEPGNEGPLEFLRYMQRNGIGQDME